MSHTVIGNYLQRALAPHDIYTKNARLVVDLSCFSTNVEFIVADILDNIIRPIDSSIRWDITDMSIFIASFSWTNDRTEDTTAYDIFIKCSIQDIGEGTMLVVHSKLPWATGIHTDIWGVQPDGMWFDFPRRYHDTAIVTSPCEHEWNMLMTVVRQLCDSVHPMRLMPAPENAPHTNCSPYKR